MASQNLSVEDVIERGTLNSVLDDSDIQLYLFKPQDTAKEMQRGEAAVRGYGW